MSRPGICRYDDDVWIEIQSLKYKRKSSDYVRYSIIVDSERLDEVDYDQLLEIRDLINRIEKEHEREKKEGGHQ